jgi:excisionase family DNA binding protein
MNSDRPSGIDLLKPAEVATRLRVSRTWLYDAAKRGRIPSTRIGGEEGPLRFHPDDIERWVNDARAGGVDPVSIPVVSPILTKVEPAQIPERGLGLRRPSVARIGCVV